MIKYEKCRCCGSEDITPWLSLPPTPVANALFKEPNFEKYPLDLNVCTHCGHLQLASAPDPDTVFSEYRYKSGVSNSFRKHFKEYADFFTSYMIPGKVLEIGSNDGYLLECFKNNGWDVIGVEPSEFLKVEHDNKGVPVIVDFFNTKMVEDKGWIGKFDLIVANNVLAHIPDMRDVMNGISKALKPGGLLVAECGNQNSIFSGECIDNVYHEHIDYYSPDSFSALASQYKLEKVSEYNVNTHGKSFRIILKKDDNCIPKDYSAVNEDIAKNAEQSKKVVENLLLEKGSNIRFALFGRPFVAYGSAAKAVTALYSLNLVNPTMLMVVDDNELKQNCYFPGTDKMITDPSQVDPCATVLVTAWNVFDDIREKLIARGHTGDIICMR